MGTGQAVCVLTLQVLLVVHCFSCNCSLWAEMLPTPVKLQAVLLLKPGFTLTLGTST